LLPRHLVRILTVDFPAYTTGLICTRRALTKLGLGDKHEGVIASDGIFVPRSDKRFPEYDAESKELDAEVLKYIYGGHAAAYMERPFNGKCVSSCPSGLRYIWLIRLLPHLSPGLRMSFRLLF
jgi:hypothetical protein